MAEEEKISLSRNGGSRPVPDPTELTDRAIARLEKSLSDKFDAALDIRDERLRGIDKATSLRLLQIDNIPNQIDKEVGHVKEIARVQLEAEAIFRAAEHGHLREVDDIRFQAAERLAGRESELNALALAAAFAAQKEASAKEAEYTRIASIKSESATAQAIDKLGELFATQTEALASKVDDLKDRTGRIESVKAGATETRQQGASTNTLILSVIGALISIALVGLAIASLIKP